MSLRLLKLRIMAKKIMRKKCKYAYRNVIGYFVGTDGVGAVFVSKDNSVAPKKGTFLDVFKEDKIYDIQTGKEVSAEDIFGKTFFDGDATLKIDNITPVEASLEEKIDILFDECSKRVYDLLESPAAFVMANDFFEEEEENMQHTYQRFVILYNYLKQRTQRISVEEFAYMHHELMTI